MDLTLIFDRNLDEKEDFDDLNAFQKVFEAICKVYHIRPKMDHCWRYYDPPLIEKRVGLTLSLSSGELPLRRCHSLLKIFEAHVELFSALYTVDSFEFDFVDS